MHRRGLTFLAMAVTIVFAAWLLFPDTLIARNTDIDEGVFLMVARLLHRGCDVHTFFFDQFWFFPKLLATSFKFFGDSLLVGRLTIFVFALAGSLGVGALVRQLGSKWIGAMFAIVICAASPLYIRQSRLVMADVPATACLVWALVFVFLFRERRQPVWLVLSGIFASAGLMLKPFAIGFVVTIIIILFERRIERTNVRSRLNTAIWSDLLIFVAAGAIAAAPFIDFLHLGEEYRRTIGFHFTERNWLITRVDDRWRGLLGFVRLHVPLTIFAVAGIVALRRLSTPLVALLAGEVLTTAILFGMPPWLHHYVLILPVLIVFAVLGFTPAFAQFKLFLTEWRNKSGGRPANNLIAISFVCALLVTLIDLPWLVQLERRALWPKLIDLNSAITSTERIFRQENYLVSDNALIVYLANRAIPPAAINFTFADVLKFDPMSFARFEQIIREQNVAGIIVTDRFSRNRQLMSWLEKNFELSARIEAEQNGEPAVQIFVRRDEAR